MNKPYVVFIHRWDQSMRFALDRNYQYRPELQGKIGSCKLGDVVESEVFNGYPYLSYPKGIDLDDEWIALWFNYYD